MTYFQAYQKAAQSLRVSGPRSTRIDLPSGGFVRASLYDGEDEARDAMGRNILGRIEDAAKRERSA